jgi:hypothetical protein
MNGKLLTGILVLLVVIGAALAVLPVAGCHESSSATDPGDGSNHHAEVQTIDAEIDCTPLYNTLPATVKICVDVRNLVDSPRVVDGRIDLWLGQGGSSVDNWRFREVEIEPNGSWQQCWNNHTLDLESLEEKNIARLRVMDVTPPPYNQPPYPPSGFVAEDFCFFWGERP